MIDDVQSTESTSPEISHEPNNVNACTCSLIHISNLVGIKNKLLVVFRTDIDVQDKLKSNFLMYLSASNTSDSFYLRNVL